MAKPKIEFKSIMRRPIDCTQKVLEEFGRVVLINGEVPIANLKRGIPRADMLFFVVTEGKAIGVSCVRYQNRGYHKHMFEQAGVPEMYNPHSLEWCWLSVLPEYQSKGAWSAMQKMRQDYMAERPGHAIVRLENERITGDDIYGFQQAGEPFLAPKTEHMIRLGVSNHDPIFDPNKKITYR